MRRLSITLAAVLVVTPLVAAAGPSLSARDPEPTVRIDRTPLVPVPWDQPLANDLNYRLTHGLESDVAYIRGLHARAAQGDPDVVDAYGFPMTKAEVDDLRSFKIAAHEALSSVPERVTTAGAAVAGTWMDQDDRSVTIYTNGLPDDLAGSMASALSTDVVQVHIQPTDVGISELDAMADDIFDDRDTLREEHGIELQGIGARPEHFEVFAEIDGDLESAAETLGRLYPDVPLVVTPAGETVDHGTQFPGLPPWKGGMAIENTSVGRGCNTGFVARDRVKGKRKYFVITAGHCATVGHKFRQGTSTYGYESSRTKVTRSKYVDRGDAAAFPIRKKWRSAKVVRRPGRTVKIRGVQKKGSDSVGDDVYLSSQQGQTVFGGTLFETSYDRCMTDAFGREACFKYLRRANFNGTDGDSGGPVWERIVPSGWRIAAGIYKGTSRSSAMYTHIADAKYVLGIAGLVY